MIDLFKLSSREELDRLVEARSLVKSSSASQLFPLNSKGAKELYHCFSEGFPIVDTFASDVHTRKSSSCSLQQPEVQRGDPTV